MIVIIANFAWQPIHMNVYLCQTWLIEWKNHMKYKQTTNDKMENMKIMPDIITHTENERKIN